jgi:hypothetical protein
MQNFVYTLYINFKLYIVFETKNVPLPFYLEKLPIFNIPRLLEQNFFILV